MAIEISWAEKTVICNLGLHMPLHDESEQKLHILSIIIFYLIKNELKSPVRQHFLLLIKF